MATAPAFADIGILNYPGAQAAALHGLTDLFLTANRLGARRGLGNAPLLRVSHWSLDKAGTVRRDFHAPDPAPKKLDILILPPSLNPRPLGDAQAPLLRWLKVQHGKGTTLCSVCAGAFLLAETVLLDGRRPVVLTVQQSVAQNDGDGRELIDRRGPAHRNGNGADDRFRECRISSDQDLTRCDISGSSDAGRPVARSSGG